MQEFESSSDLFNLQSGIEMLGWRGFHSKPEGNEQASSSKTGVGASTEIYQPNISKPEFGAGFSEIGPVSAWQQNRLVADDSLSLCPIKFSNLGGLQSFDLRENGHQIDMRFASSNSGDEYFGKSVDLQSQENFVGSQQFHLQQLRNSKYLLPTQELLNEFCCLGTKQKNSSSGGSKNKFHRSNQWEEGGSSKNQLFYSLDFVELQKRKAKLVSMAEEVDRRYRRYCEQMRTVVSSFEAVAGPGAASVYSSLALKAMSKHFRCLRDGIVGQIKATQKAMGEKDTVAPGTTRGETPRLKLLDQTLRQQRALQQMGMMESHPWRPQRGLPERSVSVLRAWLFEHFLHPYPSDVDKHILARQTGLSRSQVSNWFINARVRLWKPMVEEMYLEETKEKDNKDSDGAQVLEDDDSRPNAQRSNQIRNPNSNNTNQRCNDQKPSLDELAHDSDYLSAIVNNSSRTNGKNCKGLQQRAENFGMVDLDFSSYNTPTSTVTYANSECAYPGYGGGVSLTLGLQQHSGGGVSLSFSPTSQHSLLMSTQQMQECPPIQYSILDDETQNPAYRNLMGAQLLHDLAG